MMSDYKVRMFELNQKKFFGSCFCQVKFSLSKKKLIIYVLKEILLTQRARTEKCGLNFLSSFAAKIWGIVSHSAKN